MSEEPSVVESAVKPSNNGMKLTFSRGCLLRLLYLPAFMVLTAFSISILKVDFLPEITFRVIFGFLSFLSDPLFTLPLNARSAVVGLLVFFALLALTHRLLSKRAYRSGRPWSMGLSFALVMLPLLLLSGTWLASRTILQLERVTVRPWKTKYIYEPGPRIGYAMEVLRQGVIDHAAKHGGLFPESLGTLDPEILPQVAWTRKVMEDETAADAFTYLGAGMGMNSDPALPLLISAPFDWADTPVRAVITIGGELQHVHPEEIDSWIQRSLEARRVLQSSELQMEVNR